MSWTQFEADVLETLNEASDVLSAGLIRRKIQSALRRIEGLWNFPYMFQEVTASVPIGNSPIVSYSGQWKVLQKVALWDTVEIDSDMNAHGGGSTGFVKFLQRINETDLKINHFETLNVETSWGEPIYYQVQKAGYVENPISQTEGSMIFRTNFQLYPPPSAAYILSLIGYVYTEPYTDDNADEDHWMLNYGRELLEAWTILSLTPALQDATLTKFYADLVPSAQEVLLKSEANSDWEGLDETVEYIGESDI